MPLSAILPPQVGLWAPGAAPRSMQMVQLSPSPPSPAYPSSTLIDPCGPRTAGVNPLTSIPLFFIVSDSDFQIPVHFSRPLCHRQSLLSNPLTAVGMTALDGVNGTVCNAQQYQQSLQSYDSSSPSISCLTRGESIGLVFTAEASLLSYICVIVILIWIGGVVQRNIHWYRKTFPNGNWKLFQGPADIYMFSLFVFEILQAIGGSLNIRALLHAQGLVEQIGELGVALITLFLAIHTFVAAVLQVGLKARGVALSLVCLACVFITLWVAIGAGIHKNYETPTPYWCWISPQFPGERLGGLYIWMWIALFASTIYIPLYFWAEGFWSVDEEYKFHWWNVEKRVGYVQRRATLGMLLYPLAYSLVVLPLTIAGRLQFSHHHVSSAATFFASSMFHLSGAINVLLFLIVRPELLLFPRPRQLDELEIELTPQEDTGPAIFSDPAKFQLSPEPISAVLEDEGPGDNAVEIELARLSSRAPPI
ncbi:hypothetical protein BGY98DRAFT_934918 [Russula aff. rugulosa BPL654]|nr:hypothetical protein BGY98DRAFT_934918 [Russula aff. rugulosa BPL654]